jgi:hypothetical protein
MIRVSLKEDILIEKAIAPASRSDRVRLVSGHLLQFLGKVDPKRIDPTDN